MRLLASMLVAASVFGCAPQPTLQQQQDSMRVRATAACGAVGVPSSDPGYRDCMIRMGQTIIQSDQNQRNADDARRSAGIDAAARQLQELGRPKPAPATITPFTCNRYGNTTQCY